VYVFPVLSSQFQFRFPSSFFWSLRSSVFHVRRLRVFFQCCLRSSSFVSHRSHSVPITVLVLQSSFFVLLVRRLRVCVSVSSARSPFVSAGVFVCSQCTVPVSFPHHRSPSGVFVLARRLRVCVSRVVFAVAVSFRFVPHHCVSHHSPPGVFVLRVLFPVGFRISSFVSLIVLLLASLFFVLLVRRLRLCFQVCPRSTARISLPITVPFSGVFVLRAAVFVARVSFPIIVLSSGVFVLRVCHLRSPSFVSIIVPWSLRSSCC
jgi:hypothetical protein